MSVDSKCYFSGGQILFSVILLRTEIQLDTPFCMATSTSVPENTPTNIQVELLNSVIFQPQAMLPAKTAIEKCFSAAQIGINPLRINPFPGAPDYCRVGGTYFQKITAPALNKL